MQISTSLASVCSFLATEPNMRKERIPFSCCNSCLHELIKRIHYSLVFIFINFLFRHSAAINKSKSLPSRLLNIPSICCRSKSILPKNEPQ